MGFFWVVDRDQIGDPIKPFFAMFAQKTGQKTGTSLHRLFRTSDPLLQSIGRGRISREGAIDLRESRERRDKIFAEKEENVKILDQKQKFKFSMLESGDSQNVHFFGRVKTNFGGGYNFKSQNWLARFHPPGAYSSMPHPVLGAKDIC